MKPQLPHLRWVGGYWEATLPGHKAWGNTPLDAYRILLMQARGQIVCF